MKKGIIGVLGVVSGAGIGCISNAYFTGKRLEEKQVKLNKFEGYYTVLNKWLLLKQEGKSIEKYFLDNHYQSVAIYGMGELGERLLTDLMESKNIDVKYAIDQNSSNVFTADLDVKSVDEDLEEVDVVVVTPTFAYKEVSSILADRLECEIVSLEDVVFAI